MNAPTRVRKKPIEVALPLEAINKASAREKSITLEVEADIPAGAPDQVVRTVNENSKTLKFTNYDFERE
jgi:hypothetical protein